MPKDYYPVHVYHQTYFEFLEWEGKLALSIGWSIDNDKPQYYRDVKVSKISIDKWDLEYILGTRVRSWDGNIGSLEKPIMGALYVDVSNWSTIREYKPIPKPRANRKMGHRYNWVWKPDYMGGYEGRWVKQND